MQQRKQIYVLAGLVFVLAVLLWMMRRGPVAELAGRSSVDVKFQPLDVREPQLRHDLLAKLLKLEYTGSHRNIFVGAPPPVVLTEQQKEDQRRQKMNAEHQEQGPHPPPPLAPVDVSGIQLFGYEINRDSGKRFAFFLNGEDVVIAAEGDTLLSRFRLLRIGDDSAEVEEISTGRHASVAMVQPPADQGQGGIPQ
jgi:hypothetical protein